MDSQTRSNEAMSHEADGASKRTPTSSERDMTWRQWWRIRVVYWSILAYNVALCRVFRIRRWWSRIDDAVIVGGLPFHRDVARLHALGVRGVVNLCMEHPGPTARYQDFGIEQLWAPTIDFTHPSLETIRRGVEFIDRFAERGEVVYVHCNAGRARSATVALCWLCKTRGLSVLEAQDLLVRKRAQVNRRLGSRPVVLAFAAEAGGGEAGGGEEWKESGGSHP